MKNGFYLLFIGLLVTLTGARTFTHKTTQPIIHTTNTQMIKVVTPTATDTPEPTERPIEQVKGSGYTVTSSYLLTLVNEQRRINGLHDLVEISILDNAAYMKARDLQNTPFSHTDSYGRDFTGFFRDAGWYGLDAQDLLEFKSDSVGSDSDAIAGWMNSPEHRANILETHAIYFGYARVGKFEIADFGN